MLISDQHRLILMLPQKCASLTLQKRLEPICDVQEHSGRGQRYEPELGRLTGKHLIMRDASCLTAFQSRPSHLKACFVRNPYDRVYSWFQWVKLKAADAKRIHDRRESLKVATDPADQARLSKVLKSAEANLKRLEDVDFDFNAYLVQHWEKFRPIHHFTHQDGELQMSFVGRVETFETDFKKLCTEIGYTPDSMDNGNVQSASDSSGSVASPKYLEFYNAEGLEAVNQHHALDFEYFNYDVIST